MTNKEDGVKAIEKNISDTLFENYMPYAMSVIISRAIPEIDGFKPAHRKLLYTMYKMNLLGGARAKSADIVGQTMKLNPHGDQTIYETMVRLTRGNGSSSIPGSTPRAILAVSPPGICNMRPPATPRPGWIRPVKPSLPVWTRMRLILSITIQEP